MYFNTLTLAAVLRSLTNFEFMVLQYLTEYCNSI